MTKTRHSPEVRPQTINFQVKLRERKVILVGSIRHRHTRVCRERRENCLKFNVLLTELFFASLSGALESHEKLYPKSIPISVGEKIPPYPPKKNDTMKKPFSPSHILLRSISIRKSNWLGGWGDIEETKQLSHWPFRPKWMDSLLIFPYVSRFCPIEAYSEENFCWEMKIPLVRISSAKWRLFYVQQKKHSGESPMKNQ